MDFRPKKGCGIRPLVDYYLYRSQIEEIENVSFV